MNNISFNQLKSGEPICIMISSDEPLSKIQFQKVAIRNYFENVICNNTVSVTDIAFEKITNEIQYEGRSEIRVKYNVFICFNNWIKRTLSDPDDNMMDVSFTQLMSEISECFAYGASYPGEALPQDILDVDISSWKIYYFGSSISCSTL